jgi:hypothetical protein
MAEQGYIVTNSEGLNVRSQMNTTNSKNLLRRMSPNEGFIIYETYQVKGMSGLQTWGRVSNNPGGISQEYVCLSIGNKIYAKAQDAQPVTQTPAWAYELDAWARTQGYTGVKP